MSNNHDQGRLAGRGGAIFILALVVLGTSLAPRSARAQSCMASWLQKELLNPDVGATGINEYLKRLETQHQTLLLLRDGAIIGRVASYAPDGWILTTGGTELDPSGLKVKVAPYDREQSDRLVIEQWDARAIRDFGSWAGFRAEHPDDSSRPFDFRGYAAEIVAIRKAVGKPLIVRTPEGGVAGELLGVDAAGRFLTPSGPHPADWPLTATRDEPLFVHVYPEPLPSYEGLAKMNRRMARWDELAPAEQRALAREFRQLGLVRNEGWLVAADDHGKILGPPTAFDPQSATYTIGGKKVAARGVTLRVLGLAERLRTWDQVSPKDRKIYLDGMWAVQEKLINSPLALYATQNGKAVAIVRRIESDGWIETEGGYSLDPEEVELAFRERDFKVDQDLEADFWDQAQISRHFKVVATTRNPPGTSPWEIVGPERLKLLQESNELILRFAGLGNPLHVRDRQGKDLGALLKVDEKSNFVTAQGAFSGSETVHIGADGPFDDGHIHFHEDPGYFDKRVAGWDRLTLSEKRRLAREINLLAGEQHEDGFLTVVYVDAVPRGFMKRFDPLTAEYDLGGTRVDAREAHLQVDGQIFPPPHSIVGPYPGTAEYGEPMGTLMGLQGRRNQGEIADLPRGALYYLVKTYGRGSLPVLAVIRTPDGPGGAILDSFSKATDELIAYYRDVRKFPPERIAKILRDEKRLPEERIVRLAIQLDDHEGDTGAILQIFDASRRAGERQVDSPIESELGITLPGRNKVELMRGFNKEDPWPRRKFQRLWQETATYLDSRYISRGENVMVYGHCVGKELADHYVQEYGFSIYTHRGSGKDAVYIIQMDGRQFVHRYLSLYTLWAQERTDGEAWPWMALQGEHSVQGYPEKYQSWMKTRDLAEAQPMPVPEPEANIEHWNAAIQARAQARQAPSALSQKLADDITGRAQPPKKAAPESGALKWFRSLGLSF